LITGYLYLRPGNRFRQASELLQRRYSIVIAAIHPWIIMLRHTLEGQGSHHATAVGTFDKIRCPAVSRSRRGQSRKPFTGADRSIGAAVMETGQILTPDAATNANAGWATWRYQVVRKSVVIAAPAIATGLA
jgi:hypothetical protein